MSRYRRDRRALAWLGLATVGLLLLAGVVLGYLLSGEERRPAISAPATTAPPPAPTAAPPATTAGPPATTAPPATTQPPAPTTPTSPLLVTAVTPFSATVTWAGAERMERVAYGLPELGPTLWAPATGNQATLTGLRFSTTYRVWAGGATVDVTTSPPPPSPLASTAAGAMQLDGHPFFPIMVWSQCPDGYEASLAAGINLFAGNPCGGVEAQTSALAGRALSATLPGEAGLGGPGVIGWFYPDEADLLGMRARDLPSFPSATATGRLRFLTVSNHVYSGAAPPASGRSVYRGLVARADVVGFDLYPLQEWCRADRLADVYAAQGEVVRLAAGRPTFQWIEAATWRCGGRPQVSPETVRAEAWLAIAGGARGLGFFPAGWSADIAGAIAAIARDVTALGPALLSPDAPVEATGGIRAGARFYNGAFYIVAVNAGRAPTTATLRVPGLGERELTVLGSLRRIRAASGAFADSFAPLEVRVYLAPPA